MTAKRYVFHDEALSEYREAADWYFVQAPEGIAERFVTAVESSISHLVAYPEHWRIVENPGIRRCVLRRFPFLIYYLFDPAEALVTIYAVMHSSRKPGYWLDRLD